MNDFKTMGQEPKEVVAWMMAVQICFQYICATLAFSGVSVILEFILIGISFLEIVKYRIKITFPLLWSSMFIILLAFVFSILFLPEISFTMNYFERFFLFGGVAFLLGFQVEHKEKVVQRVIVIGIVLLPLIMKKEILQMNTSNQMGFVYSCLPVLIASFIGLSFGKIYIVLSIINISTMIMKFVTFAPRGLWLIVAIVVTLLICGRICIVKSKRVRIVNAILGIILLLVGVTCVINNLEFIITLTNDFLFNTFNVRVYALEKYLRYLSQGKLLNGREDLWTLAMKLISEKPLLGHGIGYYESLTGGSYCHNIILESLCEGGIFFAIPIVIYIWGIMLRLVNSFIEKDMEEFHWSVFSFGVGIVILFFSSSYWIYSIFWFFFGEYIGNSKLQYRWRYRA